jgi:hypothetical protein
MTDGQIMRMRMSRATLCGIVLIAIALTGCATWPAPPVYSQDELKARCERTGGWWRPNILDGYCEYELARQMP